MKSKLKKWSIVMLFLVGTGAFYGYKGYWDEKDMKYTEDACFTVTVNPTGYPDERNTEDAEGTYSMEEMEDIEKIQLAFLYWRYMEEMDISDEISEDFFNINGKTMKIGEIAKMIENNKWLSELDFTVISKGSNARSEAVFLGDMMGPSNSESESISDSEAISILDIAEWKDTE